MDSWYGRAAGMSVAAIYFLHCALTPHDWHFIDNANIAIHETGHWLFIWAPFFIYILMGSGFQVLLPLIFAWYFWRTRQVLGAPLCLMWAGQSLVNVSVYAGDAVVQQLQLIGGEGSFHDWHYLLGTLGLLPYTPQVATVLYSVAVCMILGGIGWAARILYQEWLVQKA